MARISPQSSQVVERNELADGTFEVVLDLDLGNAVHLVAGQPQQSIASHVERVLIAGVPDASVDLDDEAHTSIAQVDVHRAALDLDRHLPLEVSEAGASQRSMHDNLLVRAGRTAARTGAEHVE
jgi:hypothetical protein